MERLFSVLETAELFGVHKTAVYLWIKQGLPYKTEKTIRKKPRKVINPNDVISMFGRGVDINSVHYKEV